MRDLEGSISNGPGAAERDQMSCSISTLIAYFEGPLIMRDIMRDVQTHRNHYPMRRRYGFIIIIIMRDAGKAIPCHLSLLAAI